MGVCACARGDENIAAHARTTIHARTENLCSTGGLYIIRPRLCPPSARYELTRVKHRASFAGFGRGSHVFDPHSSRATPGTDKEMAARAFASAKLPTDDERRKVPHDSGRRMTHGVEPG